MFSFFPNQYRVLLTWSQKTSVPQGYSPFDSPVPGQSITQCTSKETPSTQRKVGRYPDEKMGDSAFTSTNNADTPLPSSGE